VGIYINHDCAAYVLSNLIYDNTAQSGTWNYGAGVYINNDATVLNNTIVNNMCTGGNSQYGGGIHINDSTNTVGNNIVVGNSSTYGGGIASSNNGHATLLNNDVWNNTPQNYYNINPGTNDISVDPIFVTGPLGDYYLSQTAAGQPQNSPCIDYGFATAESLELHTFTTRTDSVYDEGIVDLGYHYPINPYVTVKEFNQYRETSVPTIFFQITPTFSSSSFKIELSISASQELELCIYDGLGCLQKTLFSGQCASGKTQWLWNGCDKKGNKLPSGVYFFVLRSSNSGQFSKKVVLLKQ
jgi:hypothetical protein